MAAVAYVFTLAHVADLLGEDEDWLHEISIEMEPEDGFIGVHGVGDEYTPAFTDFGIENLWQLVEIHKQDAARGAELAATKPKPGLDRPVTMQDRLDDILEPCARVDDLVAAGDLTGSAYATASGTHTSGRKPLA